MKQHYTFLFRQFTGLLLICGISASLSAQFTITEISYNPPESGPDSLEYIEITNTADFGASLAGFYFSEGVEYTFGDVMVPSGAAVVVAIDSVVMFNNFGVQTLQWTDGALTNSGEDIILNAPDSSVMDVVDYSASSPWPSFADGTAGAGASIELCDPNTDNNDGANWIASTNDVGVEINGRKLYGSPGAENMTDCNLVVEFPAYPIGLVTTIDGDGVADSFGVRCQLEGVVHGINFRPQGLTFALIDDANDGINVFELSDNFGYDVVEGDRVQIKGQIDQFRGVIQIRPQEITVLSQGNELAEIISLAAEEELSETTESQLAEIVGVRMVDVSQWSASGSGFNVTFTNGITEYVVRVDADTEIFNIPPPGDENDVFRIIGIGGQFANDEPPYEGGYQLFPRYITDIEIIVSTDEVIKSRLEILPNPASDMVVITGGEKIDYIDIFSAAGKLVKRTFVQMNSANIDISGIQSGMYVIQAHTDTGVIVDKLMVR